MKTNIQNADKVIFGENTKTDGRFMIVHRGFISTQVLVSTQIINIYHTHVSNGKTVSKGKSSYASQYDKAINSQFVEIDDVKIPCDIVKVKQS